MISAQVCMLASYFTQRKHQSLLKCYLTQTSFRSLHPFTSMLFRSNLAGNLNFMPTFYVHFTLDTPSSRKPFPPVSVWLIPITSLSCNFHISLPWLNFLNSIYFPCLLLLPPTLSPYKKTFLSMFLIYIFLSLQFLTQTFI